MVQRQIELEKDEEGEEGVPIQGKLGDGEWVQRQAEVNSEPESSINQARGSGHPLPDRTREYFESRLGYDFRNVRIHSSYHAANAAKSVNARAFTFGRDIVFGAKQYAPDTTEGKTLLAHELIHVIQQNGKKTGIQREVRASSTLEEHPDADVCLVHLHADEQNALAAARYIYHRYRANLVTIHNQRGNQRLVEVRSGDGRRCMADPNRIFSTQNITEDCATKPPCASSDAAASEIHSSRFRRELIGNINQCRWGSGDTSIDVSDDLLPIIAFHNNSPRFSVAEYAEPSGSERWAAASEDEIRSMARERGPRVERRLPSPIENPAGPASRTGPTTRQYYRNFILTTDIEDFLNFAEAGYNVVLQSRTGIGPTTTESSPCSSTGDDGSLSVALRNSRYLNLEIAGKQRNQDIYDFNRSEAEELINRLIRSQIESMSEDELLEELEAIDQQLVDLEGRQGSFSSRWYQLIDRRGRILEYLVDYHYSSAITTTPRQIQPA